MNRTTAYALLNEYVKDQSLVRHCLCVEAAMRAYARKHGEDEEKWGVVGLLHDFDYERWPNPPDHPLKGAEILRGLGCPEDVIYAIKSHADYLPDCPRVRPIEKALYACDELAGLITATAVLRPNGIMDLMASSVKKKMKSKGFARNINRDDVERGAADFGVDLTEHIQFEIDALKMIAAELGLECGGSGREAEAEA
jgi:putative nucleotidyltransferase with HDIG domain